MSNFPTSLTENCRPTKMNTLQFTKLLTAPDFMDMKYNTSITIIINIAVFKPTNFYRDKNQQASF